MRLSRSDRYTSIAVKARVRGNKMKKDIYVQKFGEARSAGDLSMEERQTGVARPDYWEKRIEIPRPFDPTGPLWLRNSTIASLGLCWGAPVNLNLVYLGPWHGLRSLE